MRIFNFGIIGICVPLLFSAAFANCAETNVDVAITKVRTAASGKKLTPNQTATNLFDLMETFKMPAEHGKICFAAALLYGMSAGRVPSQVAAYCEKALEYPLAPAKACHMYVFLGDAYEAEIDTASVGEIPSKRLLALRAFFKGLGVLEGPLKYQEKMPLPAVRALSLAIGDTNDAWYKREVEPAVKKMREEHESELKLRKEVLEQNELLDSKRRLERKIVELYSRFPEAADEVRTEGGKIIKDRVLIEELMREIKGAGKTN